MILLAAEDIAERQEAEEALRKSHVELQSHAGELSRFSRGAVGRELRMIGSSGNECRASLGKCEQHAECCRQLTASSRKGSIISSRGGRYGPRPGF